MKSTIYIYMGVIIGFFVRAHFFPKFLSEAEIGVLALLISYGSIFAQVAALGFDHATVRYFPYFRDTKSGHHGFLSLYLLVVTTGFLVFLVIYYLIEGAVLGQSGLFSQYYILCIPLTAGLLIFNVMDKYNSVLYNASTGVLLREFVLRVLQLACLVLLIYEFIGFKEFAWIYVGLFLLVALMLTGFVVWRGEFHLNLGFRSFERNIFKAMASISFFGFVTGFNNVAIQQVNNILIDFFYDEAKTGIYFTNLMFATMILMPSRGLNKIAPTLISDAFKNNDLQKIRNIHYKSTINQMLFAMLLFIGLCINLHNVYKILPESYAIGLWVIVLTGIANVIQMSSGVSRAIIGFSSFYRYSTYLSIIQLVLLVGLNIIFLPIWGITGAAIATLIAAVVLNILKFLKLKRKFNIQPYGKKHLVVCLVALICFTLNELIPAQPQVLVDILTRSIVISIFFIGGNYLFKTSRQLNEVINNTLARLRIR